MTTGTGEVGVAEGVATLATLSTYQAPGHSGGDGHGAVTQCSTGHCHPQHVWRGECQPCPVSQ